MTLISTLFRIEPSGVAFFKRLQTLYDVECLDGIFSVPYFLMEVFFEDMPDFSKFPIQVVVVFLQSLFLDSQDGPQTLAFDVAHKMTFDDKVHLLVLYNTLKTKTSFPFFKSFFLDLGKSLIPMASQIDKDLLDFVPRTHKPQVIPFIHSEFRDLHSIVPSIADSKRGPKTKTTFIFHPASFHDVDGTRLYVSKISSRLQRLGIATIDSSHGFEAAIQANNLKTTKIMLDLSVFTDTEPNDPQVLPAYVLASLAMCPVLKTKDEIKDFLANPKTFNAAGTLEPNYTLAKVRGSKLFIDTFGADEDVSETMIRDIFKIFDCELVANPYDADYIIRYRRNVDNGNGSDNKSIYLIDLL